MSGTAQGKRLAGRYVLGQRLRGGPDGVFWSGRDATLERDVQVRVLRRNHPQAAALLDAARRVALVEDPRLVRVFDVGTREGASYVVEEAVHGRALPELVTDGPLPVSQTVALMHDVAAALAAAAARDLHHLRLTPADVLLRADGSVKVSGVGLAAATAAAGGWAEPGAQRPSGADRVDVTALAGLLYYCLTATWPLGDAGYPPAAYDADGDLRAVRHLRDDVPTELDQLCARLLSGDTHDAADHRPPGAGDPRTAEELAAALRALEPMPSAPKPSAPKPSPPAPSRPVPSTAAPNEPAPSEPARADSSAAPAAQPQSFAQLWQSAVRSGIPDQPTSTLPIAVPYHQPPQEEARRVLTGMATAVGVGLLVAVVGLWDVLPGNDEPQRVGPVAAPVSTSASAPTASARRSPSPAGSGASPQVSGIRSLDPQGGDGKENPSTARLAADGDLGTAWDTETYSSAEFGGLKRGLGLALQLREPAQVRSVDITMSRPGARVEIYGANTRSIVNARRLGGGTLTTVSARLPVRGASTHPYLIVWITALPPAGDGYRAEVSEIRLS